MQNLQKNIQIVLSLYRTKKINKAENLAKELLSKNPNVVYLYNLTGLILNSQGKTDEAISYFKKGLKIDESSFAIYDNLGSSYKLKGLYKEAEHNYKKSIKLNNKSPEAQNNLGSLYLDQGNYKSAINCFTTSLEINKKFYPSYYNLGIAYTNLGDFSKAKKNLSKCIEINPNLSSAHRNLSKLIKYKKNDEHLNFLEKKYEDQKLPDQDKSQIAFAIGKAYDDIKDYDKAFKYFKEGNDLRKKSIIFDYEKEKKDFIQIKKIFNISLMNKFNFKERKKIIFILGMPRSGTTLIEQIISSHPEVFGGDEIFALPKIIKDKYKKFDENTKIIEDDLKVISKDYMEYIDKISDKYKVVTDKMPINFKWIGFISLILPNAKIIHCKRNPKDICISIFKNYFVNRNLNFAYEINDIINYYNLYYDLMKHWEKILGTKLISVNYEKIIKNTEYEIRDLLSKCDLKWNSRCLNFYKNKRPIKTASDTQVREKIYSDSVNSSKFYEKYLKDHFSNLKIN